MYSNASFYMEEKEAQSSRVIYPRSHSCMAQQLRPNPESLRHKHCLSSLSVPQVLMTSCLAFRSMLLLPRQTGPSNQEPKQTRKLLLLGTLSWQRESGLILSCASPHPQLSLALKETRILLKWTEVLLKLRSSPWSTHSTVLDLGEKPRVSLGSPR